MTVAETPSPSTGSARIASTCDQQKCHGFDESRFGRPQHCGRALLRHFDRIDKRIECGRRRLGAVALH
jgi:hypothetical protein